MKEKIRVMSILACVALVTACVPEPLTGQDADDMSVTPDSSTTTPDMATTTMDQSVQSDTGPGTTDQGEADMPAGPVNPFMTSDTAAVMAGETTFTSSGCTGCHNADGTGVVKIPLSTTAGKNEVFVFTSIKDGIAAKGMPAYGPTGVSTQLTDDQIWQVVTYIQATYGQ